MRIEHLAIWTNDIEKMREFYLCYFGAVSNDKYVNDKKGFESYFLSFESGCRLEIMKDRNGLADNHVKSVGLAHFAVSVGNREGVLELTEKLRSDGFTIAGEPRTTGDGYFESVILDPDGNHIEITI